MLAFILCLTEDRVFGQRVTFSGVQCSSFIWDFVLNQALRVCLLKSLGPFHELLSCRLLWQLLNKGRCSTGVGLAWPVFSVNIIIKPMLLKKILNILSNISDEKVQCHIFSNFCFLHESLVKWPFFGQLTTAWFCFYRYVCSCGTSLIFYNIKAAFR